MNRVNLSEMYKHPDSYRPPPDLELSHNTEYPNLNSKEYRVKQDNGITTIQPFLEFITINKTETPVLVSNNYYGRIWNGSFWGYKDMDTLLKQGKTDFQVQCSSSITGIKFIRENILLITEANGRVGLWSTKASVRSDGYCLFRIGEQDEHCGYIQDIDIFPLTRNDAVTVSSDACIKIWNVGSANVESLHTYRDAHSDAITGVSVNKKSDKIFVTVSRDKSSLIWDYRQLKPASAIVETHSCPITTVYWTSDIENQELIMFGDECGKLYLIDQRKPNIFLKEINVYNRPVHKINFEGKRFSVCGNTNRIIAYDIEKDMKVILDNSDAENFVRDTCFHWNELYTISWDKKIRKYNLR